MHSILHSLSNLTVLSCVYHSDLDEAGLPIMNGVSVDSPNDDDEESYHALHRDLEHDEYDSDSTSVPLHIKSINTLQRKVKQLEATLKQYSGRRDSLDDIGMVIHHDQQPTPISDGGYQPRTKGNIV